MPEIQDAGIDKARILAEIGVQPIPAPSPAPAPPRAETSVLAPPAARREETRAVPAPPAIPPAPPPAPALRPSPPRLVRHRIEASVIFLGFIAVLWLAVGLATGQSTPLLLGGAFLTAGLGAALALALGKKP